MLIFLCLVFTIFTLGHSYDEFDLVDPTKTEEDSHLDVEDFMNFEDIDANPLVEILRRRNFDPDEDHTMEAGLAEGDIALPSGVTLEEFVSESNDAATGRNAIRSPFQLWNHGQIPYALSSKYGPLGRKVISKAMDIIHNKTCIRFVPREHQRDYVFLSPVDGCTAYIGRRRQGGRQPISLEAGCLQVGTIIHELIHAIGFFHEQSRRDRDEYVRIHWENIADNKEDQFKKQSVYKIDHLNTEYDYGSLMHYGEYEFSINRFRYKTITPLKSTNGQKLGQREGPTDIDILRINLLYQCHLPVVPPTVDVVTTEPSVIECADKKPLCAYWKTGGYCQSSVWFMQEHCPKVCGFCGTNPSTTVLPPSSLPPVITLPGPQCKDNNGNCGKWQKKGHCSRHSTFMNDRCPKSCSRCKSAVEVVDAGTTPALPVNGGCEDNYAASRCSRYARTGACTVAGRDGRSMREHCKASCGLCESVL